MNIPTKYILPIEGIDYAPGQDFIGNTWRVISDRSYNKTFSEPGTNQVLQILPFLSEYYVKERKKDYLHIIQKSEETLGAWNDFGWIYMENLLLWRHCLVKSFGLDLRVIVLKSPLTSNFFKYDEKLFPSNDTEKDFLVFYVYKLSGDNALLGRLARIPEGIQDNREILVDWFPLDQMIPLTSYLFLEPDCNLDSANGGDKTCIIFKKTPDVLNYLKTAVTKEGKYLWKQPCPGSPSAAKILRFPVINKIDSIFEVAVPSNPDNLNGQEQKAFSTGFCSLKNSSGSQVFEEVVLMEKSDLSQMINTFESLSDSRDRLEFFTILSELVKMKNPSNISDPGTLSMSQLNLILFGFPGSQFLPDDFAFGEITNTFSLSEEDFQSWKKEISNKSMRLNDFLNASDDSMFFQSNGAIYYWIPAKLMI